MEIKEFAEITGEEMIPVSELGMLSEEEISGDPDFANEDFEKFFEEYLAEGGKQVEKKDDEAPTTEPSDDDAAQEATDEAPTTELQEDVSKIKVKVKRDHKEQEIEIGHDELPGLWQRAENYDRLHKKYEEQSEMVRSFTALAKQLGYESAEEMLKLAAEKNREEQVQELVDEGTARKIAEDFVDRKINGTKKHQKQDAAEDEEDAKKDQKPAVDYAAQVDELFQVRPDLRHSLKKLPAEVARAVVQEGIPLRTAYAEWEARQARAEQKRLKEENDRYVQAAEKATRAPVRGTKDANTEKGAKDDPFLAAFLNDRL